MGLDLGGTGSRLVVATPEGTQLGIFEGAPGNPVRVGVEAVLHTLEGLLASAGAAIRFDEVVGVCVGMAGCSHPAATGLLNTAFAGLSCRGARRLTDDGRTALAAAVGLADGLLVHAGTGSGVVAVRGDTTLRLGGFGPLLGDEGSGHAIGVAAVRLVCQASEGRAPETALSAPLLEALGGLALRQLPFAASRGQIAFPELVPLVAQVAEAGDGPAGVLLDQAGQELAALARAAALRAGLPAGQVVAYGGSILQRVPRVRAAFAEALLTGHPGLRLGPPAGDGYVGALVLAQADLRAGRDLRDF